MERRRTVDDDDRGSRRGRDDDDRGRDRDRGRDDDDRRSRGRDDDDRGRDRDRGRDDDRGSRRSRDDDDDSRSSSRGGGRRFEYKERDPSHLRERQQENSKFDSYLKPHIRQLRINDGDNTLRALPPTWEEAKHFGLDIWVHYGVGADRQTYLCPEKMGKGKCPICEERRAFGKDADLDSQRDKDYMKELDPKRRVLIYAVDRDHERDGVGAWAMPAGTDEDLVKICKDKRTGEVLAIDHPDKGYDFSFERTGKGKNTKYEGLAIARNSSPLGDDRWLEFAVDNPLPDQLVFFDYDHIAREFGGGGGPREHRDDDDDRGRDSRDRRNRDDDDRGRDRDRDRGRGDDRDDRRDSRGSRDTKDEVTWESVHEMRRREMEDLIEAERLDINHKEAKDDDDLADWICEEMKLKKSERREERRSSSDDSDSRLRDLRERIRD
jgi:hypothetical protein